jgi:hypothetical protein
MTCTNIHRMCITVAVVLVAACSTTPSTPVSTQRLMEARKAVASAKAVTDASPTATKDEKVDKAFGAMMDACKASLSQLERTADNLRSWKIGIATAGALVGGIAIPALTATAPASNAVWISGLGGFSGVTNAAQQSMTEVGWTPTSVLQTRQSILDRWEIAMRDYFDPKVDAPARLLAVQKALTACSLYAITIPDPPSSNGGASSGPADTTGSSSNAGKSDSK